MQSITVDQVWWCTPAVTALAVEGPGGTGDPQPLRKLGRGCVLAVWSDSVNVTVLYRLECLWNLWRALNHPSVTLHDGCCLASGAV